MRWVSSVHIIYERLPNCAHRSIATSTSIRKFAALNRFILQQKSSACRTYADLWNTEILWRDVYVLKNYLRLKTKITFICWNWKSQSLLPQLPSNHACYTVLQGEESLLFSVSKNFLKHIHLAKVSQYFQRSASVLHAEDFCWRIKRFKAANFWIEVLVSMDLWAESAAFHILYVH